MNTLKVKAFWVRHWPLFFTLAIIAAIALVKNVVHAAGPSYTISWQAPTQYIDNTALPATDIAFYTVTINGVPQKVTGALQLASTVPCGNAILTVSVTTTATAKYPNAVSDPAGPVTYASGVTCKPNPPGALTVK